MRFSHYDGKQPKQFGSTGGGGGGSSVVTKLLETNTSDLTTLNESLENSDCIYVV